MGLYLQDCHIEKETLSYRLWRYMIIKRGNSDQTVTPQADDRI